MTPDRTELELTRRERDFYQRLLGLSTRTDLRTVLAEGLALTVERLGATVGFLGVFENLDEDRYPDWIDSVMIGGEGTGGRSRGLSRSVVRQAVDQRRVVSSDWAARNPDQPRGASLRRLEIEAVLCVPLLLPGQQPRCIGVLYVHRSKKGGGLTDELVKQAQDIARLVAPLAHLHLRHKASRAEGDATAPYRARLQVEEIVGRSSKTAEMLDAIERACLTQAALLVLGPTGSGKSLVAKAVWRNSSRRDQPFVHLDCGRRSDELFAAELFGTVPGAYTDAKDRRGKISQADGGVLFLDEVGNLSAANQAALLKFLDTKQYHRVGEDEPSTADVRVIAATRADLFAGMKDGSFRDDLYYRLAGLIVEVPSLDERREDLRSIILAVVNRVALRDGFQPLTVSAEALALWAGRPWPGNVRELENEVTRALVAAIARGDRAIRPVHLTATDHGCEPERWKEAMRRYRRRFVDDALAACDGNISQVAKRIGVSRQQLHTWLREQGDSPVSS